MRYFRKAAAAAAAAGLATVGAVTATGGVAQAATSQVAVSCSTSAVVLSAGVTASCTEGATTVVNPTSFTLTTSSPGLTGSALTALQSDLSGLGLTGTSLTSLISSLQNIDENVSFDVACSVDGQTVTQPETFSSLASGASQAIDLQTAVGAPAPNSCTIKNFTVSSLVTLSALDVALINGLPSSTLSTPTTPLGVIPLLPTSLSGVLSALGLNLNGLNSSDLSNLLNLSISAQLTASTAVPGAIWMQSGTASSGFAADLCADDANNGNSGSSVQSYQCNSDLAQSWVQDSIHQLVRNGDCMTEVGGNGGNVYLERCSPSNAFQQWHVSGTGGSRGTIINASSGLCLTAKSQNFAQLKTFTCNGGADMVWSAPAPSAA